MNIKLILQLKIIKDIVFPPLCIGCTTYPKVLFRLKIHSRPLKLPLFVLQKSFSIAIESLDGEFFSSQYLADTPKIVINQTM